MSYRFDEEIKHFCLRLPQTVQDWLDESPPTLDDDYSMEVAMSLAQCLSQENTFEVESLVDCFHEYLVEEYTMTTPSGDDTFIWNHERFFADLYMVAATLCADWELPHYHPSHPLIRCRLNAHAVRRDYGMVLITLDERSESLFYSGEFDYLREGEKI